MSKDDTFRIFHKYVEQVVCCGLSYQFGPLCKSPAYVGEKRIVVKQCANPTVLANVLMVVLCVASIAFWMAVSFAAYMYLVADQVSPAAESVLALPFTLMITLLMWSSARAKPIHKQSPHVGDVWVVALHIPLMRYSVILGYCIAGALVWATATSIIYVFSYFPDANVLIVQVMAWLVAVVFVVTEYWGYTMYVEDHGLPHWLMPDAFIPVAVFVTKKEKGVEHA